MQITPTPFSGLFLITPKVFGDQRGYFFEAWNEKQWADAGIQAAFVQDNQSGSMANVIRGLHFQVPPHAQAKLVRVVRGGVLDVVVDLRRKEPTFGQHFSVELSDKNHQMLYIPEGFAHGFRTLENDTVFFYKCTQFYHKESERSILWNDPDLGIDWGTDKPILSEKDQDAPLFRNFNSPF